MHKPSPENIKLKSLEFKNVSFKYPNTEEYILKNMSFTINEGGHYAFVGVNGAGKTTITKLITGLYEDFEGEILINGKSISKYGQSQLKALTSVVYQDFAKYYISFKDNISLGNINNMCEHDQRKNIQNTIKIMELDDICENMSNGIETNLGKIKSDSVDLSGGQWQRVAIARGLYKSHNMIVLDESTAAIDPVMETQVYKKFAEISKGKMAVIVTHRLGSAKIANRIVVMDKGKIDDIGTHEELMKRKGKYKDMYESQSKWYAR